MRRFVLALIAIISLNAEILDRLAIALGKQVISELQLDEEIRVTAFLNDRPIIRTEQERRAAADRLVQQLLVKREMDLSHYAQPTNEEVDAYYSSIRSAKAASGKFTQMLTTYQLTPAILKEHLAFQLTTLKFIEYRFRPDIGISDSDIENYYANQTAVWKASHPGEPAPSLEASRQAIRQALIEDRTNQVLNTWIEETRKRVDIVYVDQSLRR